MPTQLLKIVNSHDLISKALSDAKLGNILFNVSGDAETAFSENGVKLSALTRIINFEDFLGEFDLGA